MSSDQQRIEALPPRQRQVHDAFWRELRAARECGTRALAEVLGETVGAVNMALVALRRADLIPTRPPSSRTVPEEWHNSAFWQQYPGGRLATAHTRAFEVVDLPEKIPPIEEILERRCEEWDRRNTYEEARQLIPIKVDVGGPFALACFGDPHIDDAGCDIRQLRRDVELVQNTEALFGINIGDLHNNWVGRLGYIYSEQQATRGEAIALVRWLMGSVPWMFIVYGNHDQWNYGSEYLKLLGGRDKLLMADDGVRVSLELPCGKSVRINARHDFKGHSEVNKSHALTKAALTGNDHIYVAGHRHISSNGPAIRNADTGAIQYPVRLAGYKRWDSYAKKGNFRDENISGGAVIVINPDYDETQPGYITVFENTVEGVDYLQLKRAKWLKAQKKRA